MGQRLYLFPDFFKNISTERLFGEGITREDLNQYVIDILIGFMSMVQQNSLSSSCNESSTIFITYYTLTLQASVYMVTMKVRKKRQ